MTFEELEEQIQRLNKIYVNANHASRDRYYSLYNSIYESLLEMERDGTIVIQKDEKSLSYLRELLLNDGPEFSYTFIFWEKNNADRKYKIGVCIRGIPICKPV